MDNGLEIKVTPEEFDEKTMKEQLSLLYKVGLKQQHICQDVTKEYNSRFGKLETDKKMARAKLIGIAMGSGGGTAGFISWIKSMWN